MAFVDAVDSHYQEVKARIATVNPQRLVMGSLNTQDWPPQNFRLEAFYLLVLTDAPGPIEASTESSPLYGHQLQWVWVIAGPQLSAQQKAANRGLRFRINQTMKGEILTALVPTMCQKMTWGVDSNGNWSGIPHDPVEYCWWQRPRFVEREDEGLIFGSAAITVMDYPVNITV